ncbi:MAG: hypothetical protein ACI80F_002170 [Natronomonas sp.]|jgi:hypothetical protein|uniref:DUF6789 family protein n=1 Tax=Natronomonas sp. TaxID=2184060 RepID=UPI0039890B0E
MASSDSEVGTFETSDDRSEMVNIVFDGIIGAVSGAVGVASMTVVLLVAASLGGFEMSSLAMVVELTGIGQLAPTHTVALGYLLFLAGGMVTWPLLFASIGRYLPGETNARQGAFFGFILWSGFVLAFYTGYTGAELAVYVVFTLIAHLVYGFCLGAVIEYLGGREEPIV